MATPCDVAQERIRLQAARERLYRLAEDAEGDPLKIAFRALCREAARQIERADKLLEETCK